MRYRSSFLVSMVALAVLGLLLGSIVAGVAIGEMTIPLHSALAAITNRIGLSAVQVPKLQEAVIWDYRLSRVLVAAFCGAGLALSGAILQSLLRNPLAEPYVLGISAGASTGAVSVMLLGLGAGTISLSAGAFAGALLSFIFVTLISDSRQSADRTILAGVAASQLFSALTSYIVSTSANAEQARSVMFWLLGSFSGVRWPDVALSGCVVSVGLLICIWHARALDAFTFGEDAARSLGISVRRVRIVLLVVTALMTATLVSMVGAIGFVGLVIPHAVRFVTGPQHIRLLPVCALSGALFMVLADVVSRIIIAPQMLPIGVVTALVGVPFFSLILYRARRWA